jgi:inner membrane protein
MLAGRLRMDSLTHGLLGLVTAALRKPDAPAGAPPTPTDRATFLACVVAAELPDLDYLWPAEDPVLHTLRAHRGITHSLLAAPVVALVAAAVAKLVFRQARLASAYPFALGSVLVAHLLADAWTGWGTRLLLPFSERRVTLDWMMVLDPWFTLPLAVGALWGLRQRSQFRRVVLLGGGVALAYLAARIGLQTHAASEIRAAYPAAEQVQVFPKPLAVTSFRYVATLGRDFVAGEIGVLAPYEEQARVPRPFFEDSEAPAAGASERACAAAYCRAREAARRVPTLEAALSWARFPTVEAQENAGGGTTFTIADLRYHWGGEPTLRFVIDVGANGSVAGARLERGGSARSLFERFRD